ncbi:MAG TPA: flavin reductase family protein [Thiobacillus sp.]|nr:MAG: flavin reductase [Hydrogenophilales bacterium 28-61-11]OYZ57820.1 MAG: flavin reductase [Hydrogenophilales bacterium 16-61-112]HQT34719.1 flavin reductase family protein [Thiobacillus sp.]HQT69921.1 flavin reductase family protein [Thiobacillus sp.]
MSKKSCPLSKVYGLLEPGPVVLITTASKGRANIMTQSWHTLMEFAPPLLAAVISGRNDSFELLKASRECVINIPTLALADAVVGCGNTSGRSVDKFESYGLTPVAAGSVAAPLIKECYASIECRVTDTRMVNQYNLFILEAVKAWLDPSLKNPRTLHHRGNGAFMVAGETVKLASKMK